MKKRFIIFLAVFSLAQLLVQCNKVDYPAGLPEYDNYYYVGFLPWNNSTVTVSKSQTTLISFPVEFYSSFVRSYDAIIHYRLDTAGLKPDSLAVAGKDFDIVDKNGTPLKAEGDSVYTITFPQARQGYDTIYVKMLNNSAPGNRYINIVFSPYITSQYTIGTFTQTYKRGLKIH